MVCEHLLRQVNLDAQQYGLGLGLCRVNLDTQLDKVYAVLAGVACTHSITDCARLIMVCEHLLRQVMLDAQQYGLGLRLCQVSLDTQPYRLCSIDFGV